MRVQPLGADPGQRCQCPPAGGLATLRGRPLHRQHGEEEELLAKIPRELREVLLGPGLAGSLPDGGAQAEGPAEILAIRRKTRGQRLHGDLAERVRHGEQALHPNQRRPAQVGGQGVPGQQAVQAREVGQQGLVRAGERVVDQARPIAHDQDVARVQVAVGQRPGAGARGGERRPQGGEGVADAGARAPQPTAVELVFRTQCRQQLLAARVAAGLAQAADQVEGRSVLAEVL